MQIVFTKDYLSDLYYGRTSGKKHRFQPEVIKKYIKVVNILKQAGSVEDLFHFVSLNYERLIGDKAGLESVRVTDRYRLEIKTSKMSDETVVTICSIIELSNHYR
ncbi:MAG: type II toxin-antitoxin system RelE/ParE family toxin [Bacteroidales bacterium]|nr:type II toxin-antitoxin system RelE/ParE family toxin [Bacteroidales bacterium]